MATILSQVGWRTAVLAGGYKTYRRRVTTRLYDDEAPLNLVLLDGRTGSGKTEILARLAGRGVQTLDLEGLAQHRGSVFGGIPGQPQPSQKMFESRLLAALEALDPARPIVVEAESSKVGDRMVPPLLWRAMTGAPRVTLQAPSEVRARYLVSHYGDAVTDRAAFDATLARIPVYPGRKALETLRALADAGDLETLALDLIQTHYDPAYDRTSRKDVRPRLATIDLEGLDEVSQEQAADAIAALPAVRGSAN